MIRHSILVLTLSLFTAAWSANDHQHYMEINGTRLFVEKFGTGPPILFLHGGLMFFDNAFPKQRDYFAKRHTIIGIDQRGHGHSPDGPWQLSYRQMADDTAKIIQQLGVGPVDVIGHSDGGDVALLLALHYPDLVRRVVVSGANMRGLSVEESKAQNELSPAQYREKVSALAKRLPPYFFTDYSVASPDGEAHWLDFVGKCMRMWSVTVVITPEDLKKVSAPILVVAGDHDFYSIEETNEMFQNLPNGQLMVVPASGHGTFGSRADLMNLAITQFLDSKI